MLLYKHSEAIDMTQNPFTLSFGIEPLSFINRGLDMDEIITSFDSPNPGYRACMITGVRGSGKTVSLNYIAQEMAQRKGWIVIYLNPESDDLIESFAAELSNQKSTFQIFKDAKINLSFLGLGLEMDNIPPITDYAVAIDQMLKSLTAKGKKVLIVMDEVVSGKSVRKFVNQFQIYLGKKYNLFLLMTGLYENIEDLQNEKTLTFLYRSPKVPLTPLNEAIISENYKTIFQLDSADAMKMAKLTKGYAFAYQALGYLCYKEKKSYKNILPEYDAVLEDYVYAKIWSELSHTDQEVLYAIATCPSSKVMDIRAKAAMNSNLFNLYKTRLTRKGIVCSKARGHLQFALPRFKEFVLRQDEFYDDEL